MPYCAYARLHSSSSGIELYSTNLEVISWFTDVIKRFAPHAGIHETAHDIENTTVEILAYNLNKKDLVIWHYLVRQLGVRGWLVFQVDPGGTYHLRLEQPNPNFS